MAKLEELFKDFKASIESMSKKELFNFFNKIDGNDNEPEIESYINDVMVTSKAKVKFRLPTKKEFENLIKHFSRWNEEKKGLEILNDKGKILFLPALGYKDENGTSYHDAGSNGYYWSSTANEFFSDRAHELTFGLYSKYISCNDKLSELPVRLVSNEPFEGSIEFDGIYWKPENEEGYYRYDIAIYYPF